MKLFGNSSHSDRRTQHTASGSGEKKNAILPQTEKNADAKKAKPPLTKKQKTMRTVFIVLGAVVLAVLLAVAYFLFFYGAPPDVSPSPTPDRPTEDLLPSASPSPTVKPTKDPQTSEAPEETDEPTEDDGDPGEAPAIPMDGERRDGVYTMLLVGVDKASSSTDTIMVVSFDTKNHTLTGTSIPRDTLVNIGWFTTPKKLNAIYPGYKNDGKDPVEGLKTHVKNVLGFDVDNYVIVSLQAVVDAVDAIGGVEFDVPQGMYYSDPTQGLTISIPAGRQVLDGENALKLCRFRSDYAEGDLKRIRVQHDFLKATAVQMIKKGIPNLPALVEVILRDVETDLTSENIVWYARQFLKCKGDDVVFQTAPNIGSGINNISFVGLDVTPWLEMVNASINPYKNDVTTANVNILTFGGTAGLYSTTGAIAGGWNSFYCITCAVQSGGTVQYHGPGEHVDFSAPQTETGGETPAGEGEGETEEPDDPAETETPEPTEGPQIEVVYPGDGGGNAEADAGDGQSAEPGAAEPGAAEGEETP